jgi:dipeptidyl aminopeptidase/acylaminoacyl peptidase
MNKALLAAALLTLSACATTTALVPGNNSGTTTVEVSSEPAPPAPIEPYPSELSVEHFKNMTLSGTALTIGRVLEQNNVYAKHYITHKSNGVLISGTFSIPRGEGPFPLIVQNHGYIDPAIYTNGRGLRREQDALARAGFAVLHTDYRKHAESDPDPDTRMIYDNVITYAMDSANAVLAVREYNDPRINATKVGMLGHSMGGGVTLHLLVARPDVIDAAVLYAPINTDAWKNFERWQNDTLDDQPTLDAIGTKPENPGPWLALSQSEHLEDIEDPILLVHGTLDKDVPLEWSDDLSLQLKTLGKDVRYAVYPEEGHEFAKSWRHFIDASIAFFSSHIR